MKVGTAKPSMVIYALTDLPSLINEDKLDGIVFSLYYLVDLCGDPALFLVSEPYPSPLAIYVVRHSGMRAWKSAGERWWWKETRWGKSVALFFCTRRAAVASSFSATTTTHLTTTQVSRHEYNCML